MSYSLATLWHDRPRYLPAVVAVAFSAVLMVLQSGMVLGVLSIVSLPVDHSSADIWIGAPEVKSVDAGAPIPVRWAARLNLPAVIAREEYVQGVTFWHRASGGSELTVVHGSRLYSGAFGAAAELTPEMRSRLSEPGAVVVDESDLGRLGLNDGDGPVGEVNGKRVRVVGTVRGVKGLVGANLFCSLDTARYLLRLPADQATYLLAKCRDTADVAQVAGKLREHGDGRDPEVGVGDLAVTAQLVERALDRVDRHGEPHALAATGARLDLRVDADDPPLGVEQRATGVAVVDRRVRLNRVADLELRE